MKKKQASKKVPISTEIVPNKQPEPTKLPATMTEFYQHYYQLFFNKLTKEAQEELQRNLKKGAQVIRGTTREYENVRTFTRDVIEKAELEFDKAQTKKVEEAKKSEGGKAGGSASVPKTKGGGGKGGPAVARMKK